MAGPGISQGRDPVLLGFVPAVGGAAAPRGLPGQRALAGEVQGGGQGHGYRHRMLGPRLRACTHQKEGTLPGFPMLPSSTAVSGLSWVRVRSNGVF